MSISVKYMPDILRCEDKCNNSISVLRALKNIREQLDYSPETDSAQAAIDDCDFMIAQIANGKDIEVQSI